MTENISSYREKSTQDLYILLSDCKKILFNLRFNKSGGEVKNTSLISKSKKNIARIFTIIKEKSKRGDCA